MSIADKLTTVAENVEKVYWSGYSNGKHTGKAEGWTDGYADAENTINEHLAEPIATINEYLEEPTDPKSPNGRISYLDENIPYVYENGVTNGKQAEYDKFWDAYQENGNRTSYSYGFAGRGWTDETFIPKYNITVGYNTASYMFSYADIQDLRGILEKQNVLLDASAGGNMTNMFVNAKITHIPTLDIRRLTTGVLFSNCGQLVSIQKLIIDEATPLSASDFKNCTKLTDVEFEGVIGKDINFQYSPLSKASITSVVNALSGTASGKTATFKKDAVVNAFGSTEVQEWLDLVATKQNWTISLI